MVVLKLANYKTLNKILIDQYFFITITVKLIIWYEFCIQCYFKKINVTDIMRH